jgi:hypothetical protein
MYSEPVLLWAAIYGDDPFDSLSYVRISPHALIEELKEAVCKKWAEKGWQDVVHANVMLHTSLPPISTADENTFNEDLRGLSQDRMKKLNPTHTVKKSGLLEIGEGKLHLIIVLNPFEREAKRRRIESKT